MAVYRARETERADAAFRDPYARALAGERGERIAISMPFFEEHAWAAVARTQLFDRFVKRLVQHGVDLILNLAAGLLPPPDPQEPPAAPRLGRGALAGD